MKVYPVGLIGLKHRHTIVVGGGGIATRKVNGLLEAEARVTVISPELTETLESLLQAGRITVLDRPYAEGDLRGAFLVIAATDDPAVNQAVWHEAEQHGCLVNVADDPPHCNFIMPAIVRRGNVSISISTGGASPALARRLREKLETIIGPEYGQLADLLAEIRPDLQDRPEMAFRLVDSDLLAIIKEKGIEEARQRASQLLAEDD